MMDFFVISIYVSLQKIFIRIFVFIYFKFLDDHIDRVRRELQEVTVTD